MAFKKTALLVCCLGYLAAAAAAEQDGATVEAGFDREGRGLWDRYSSGSSGGSTSPVLCAAPMQGNMMESGVCRSKKQCQRLSGSEVAGTSCSNGNVCCSVQMTCSANTHDGQTVTNSGTHLTSPTMFNAPITCRYNFPRPDGICQVRLDFAHFMLAGPDLDSAGDCVTDSFSVVADNLNGFVTCGNGTGEHLYLQYGASDTVMASFQLGRSESKFDIVATYVPCNDGSSRSSSSKRKGRSIKLKNKNESGSGNNDSNNTVISAAPDGCSQYFTQATGTVKSFNYFSGDVTAEEPRTYQINNQKYCVCVRNIPGSSTISWRSCTNTSFLVSQSGQNGALTGNDCPTDYIDIPGSQQGRYCGYGFPTVTPVTSTHKPYMMCVNFDDSEFPGANMPFDPATNCPIGFDCVSDGSITMPPGLQPPGTFCDNDQGLACVPGNVLIGQLDSNNYGFCLQYQVT